MERRIFIKKSFIGGLSIPFLGLFSCDINGSPEEFNNKNMNWNDFVLQEATIADLQTKMQLGELSSEKIVQLYLNRIDAIDKKGPSLNSVIEVNPDALEIASQLDEERKNGKVRGPLHGIPVMIKDNMNTGDKMLTTAGSVALIDNHVTEDAFIVKKLREAGAVLLGKTNLSEWANFRSTRSSSGWSSRGGQTRNPYVLDRNPCGSSSGSGVALSANLCMLTIGTETNGSIVCPAAINGVVGIKPTVGLWSRTGIIPISFNQDTAGPMARNVRDAAIFLGALIGLDPEDPKTASASGKGHADYTQFLIENGLQSVRLGIDRKEMGIHEGVDEIMEKAFELMKSLGAELMDVEPIEDIESLYGPSFDVLKYEFKDGLNAYLNRKSTTTEIKSLKSLIYFNLANEEKAMPFFKQEILVSSEEKGDLNSKEYLEAAKQVQEGARIGINKCMDENRLDAIIAPTTSAAWCTNLVNGDHYLGGSSSPAAWSGFPNITLPAGFLNGLPIGLSIYGRAFSEPVLLQIAYAFEQATKHRKAPAFKPSLPH